MIEINRTNRFPVILQAVTDGVNPVSLVVLHVVVGSVT